MTRIRIAWDGGELTAKVEDSPTGRALLAALPAEAGARFWGEEAYFEVPLAVERSPDARQVVDPGRLCYWVEGNAVALPYGRTPISEGDECRLVAPVNEIGWVEGDPKAIGTIPEGAMLRVEPVD